MDFDEYEYLEKTVENPEPLKRKEKENGGGGGARKSAERERSRSSKHRSDEKDEDYDDDDDGNHLKGSKSRYETRDGDRRKEKGLSRHRSRSRDEVRDRYKSSWKQKDRERGRDMYREERNSRDKDSDRDQECDYDKDRRGQERDHDKKGRERECDHDKGRREQECDGKREKENDKEKERELSYRSGSRSRSERHHSDRDERESSREQELREREKERDIRDRDKEIRFARAIFRWSLWQLGQAQELKAGFKLSRAELAASSSSARYIYERLEFSSSSAFSLIAALYARRHKEKKNDVAEPEADPERDQRTVFAYQISLKADERDVYEFFSRAGRVRDVRLIMDRNSRRSKGVGYIEFYDVMTVPMAIALSGQLLLGQPVMVKPSEAEKNLVQSTIAVAGASGGLTGPYSGGARRLYVGNLHSNMTEDQLRQVFEPFGSVELVQLPLDESGRCKGFGFVQFSRLEDARNALYLNGQLEIAGWVIKVSAVTDQTGMQDIGANTGDFDDDEGGGLSLNAQSRALLMQKLDRGGSTSGITSSLGTSVINSMSLTLPVAPALGVSPAVSSLVPALLQGSVPTLPGQLAANLPVPTAHITTINTIGVPSEFVLLKNMFDPKNETYEHFDADIREDVEGECSKFGKLKHIYVDKNSAGFVYLRFENTEAAKSAQRALHGRWFAGKMITATFLTPQTYEFKFPDSR